jgi:8-oxo-dGTP diphosphatase
LRRARTINPALVVSVAVRDGDKLLMVQEGKEHCRGQWSLPGGRVEEGEGLVDAAVREVFEETGLRVRIVGMTHVLRYISQYGYHCIRFNFVGALDSGTLAIDGSEILDVAWRTFDEIAAMPDEQLRTATIARKVIEDVNAGAIFPLGFVFDAFGEGAG